MHSHISLHAYPWLGCGGVTASRPTLDTVENTGSEPIPLSSFFEADETEMAFVGNEEWRYHQVGKKKKIATALGKSLMS